MSSKTSKKKKKRTKSRALALKLGFVFAIILIGWGIAAEWFVHHNRDWIDEQRSYSPLYAAAMLWLGNPLADITDGLDLTGYDTVCEYDTVAPAGEVFFAGAPVRISNPAPSDIRILDRGEFKIGWSDSLRHPVWCAYHVIKDEKHIVSGRPGFTKDRAEKAAPTPADYTKSGYDRGHMAPNHAIASRYGKTEQKKTFMMSNIAPQSPALNRGVWRDIELRIADLWTKRYGEIWVLVGCISDRDNQETISGSNIDVPAWYYQIIIAQEDMDVRALAVLFPQSVGWRDWSARYIVTIDELEKLTGLNFNPELPEFFQKQIEIDRPSRLWPVRKLDIFRQIWLRFL